MVQYVYGVKMSFLSRLVKMCAFLLLFYVALIAGSEFLGIEILGAMIFTPLGLLLICLLIIGETYFNNLTVNINQPAKKGD